MFIKSRKRELKAKLMNEDYYSCVFICNCIKRGEDRGYKSVTLETMMNAKADKPVKKITHHVPPRQMIYTKKQIGLNHEKR